jgi:hypothetical protein
MTARSSIRIDRPILEEKRAVIDRAYSESKFNLTRYPQSTRANRTLYHKVNGIGKLQMRFAVG